MRLVALIASISALEDARVLDDRDVRLSLQRSAMAAVLGWRHGQGRHVATAARQARALRDCAAA